MNKLEAILNRLVSYYDKDDKSQIYNILKAFADEFEIVSSEYIDRADNAIGVETSDGKDLDWRWGSLLNVARRNGENDDTYRKRLQVISGSGARNYTIITIHGREYKERRVQQMTIGDASQVLLQLISYCIPCAFLFNLVGYCGNVIISAATGKGLKL